MTALLDLRNNRNAQTGQKVLIDCASGGVGIFAVQAGAYSLENGHTYFIELLLDYNISDKKSLSTLVSNFLAHFRR